MVGVSVTSPLFFKAFFHISALQGYAITASNGFLMPFLRWALGMNLNPAPERGSCSRAIIYHWLSQFSGSNADWSNISYWYYMSTKIFSLFLQFVSLPPEDKSIMETWQPPLTVSSARYDVCLSALC